MEDTRCRSLLEIVIRFAGSVDIHKRKQADTALEKMSEAHCVESLKKVIEQFNGSVDFHKRALAEKALELL